MFYTVGVMKCVIAPLFGSMVFAALMISPMLNEATVWEATVIFGGFGIIASVIYGWFCHFTGGWIRAAGFVIVMGFIFFMAMVFGEGIFEYQVNGQSYSVNVFMLPPGIAGAGFIVWVCLYPREVLSISGGVKAAEIAAVLREAEQYEQDKKEKN